MPKTLEPPPKAREAGQPYDEDGMVVVDDVPIFDEHEADDGTVYGPEELEAIAENCNRRIRDTGDYVALTDGHTQDPEDPKAVRNAKGMLAQPDILGLAGPFRVGEIGEEKPRKCILARFRYFQDKADRAMRLPRRSVEVWQEKEPTDRYFDPIALLGAEAPRRDLGMLYRYAKGRNGSQRPVLVARYQAAFPGGANTFVPGSDRDKNSKEPTMAIAPEDIQAIVAAISETDWAKWAQKQMANESMGSDPGASGPPGAPPAEDAHSQAMRRYQESGDIDGANGYMESQDEATKDRMRQRYEKEDADEATKDFYSQMKAKYAANPLQAVMWGKVRDADGFADDDEEEYGKGKMKGNWQKYQKEAADLRTRYAKEQGEHRKTLAKLNAARAELNEAKQGQCRAERYSKLTEKREAGYILDPDVEIEECVKMTPADWETHLKRIERYARAPMGTVLPLVKSLPGSDIAARTATAQRASQIAREKGIPWDAAYQQASAKN